MKGGFLNRGPRGVKVFGVDHGGWGKIIAETKQHIVIKWPSGLGWDGKGVRPYFPSQTAVCVKSMRKPALGDKLPQEWVEPIIGWENVRRAKS